MSRPILIECMVTKPQNQGKDIVLRFIVYSSLRDFYNRPLGNNRSIYFYMRIFER